MYNGTYSIELRTIPSDLKKVEKVKIFILGLIDKRIPLWRVITNGIEEIHRQFIHNPIPSTD